MEAPADLGKAGNYLWESIDKSLLIAANTAPLVHNACRQADILDKLAEHMVTAPLTVTNSRGDEVANPLLTEFRQQMSTFRTILASLGIDKLETNHQQDEDLGAAIARLRVVK